MFSWKLTCLILVFFVFVLLGGGGGGVVGVVNGCPLFCLAEGGTFKAVLVSSLRLLYNVFNSQSFKWTPLIKLY